MTAAQLKRIVPLIKNEQQWADLLNEHMPKYDIATKTRIAYFIANIAHESASFRAMEEYASGEDYDTGKLAVNLGNTPEADGDGQKYKGRGLLQITGRGMYLKCSNALYRDNRLLDKPELLESPAAATESACWCWAKAKGLNEIADKPDNWIKPGASKYTKFQWIVIKINGGLNGYNERLYFFQQANKFL